VSSMMSGLVDETDRDVCFAVDGTATYGTLHVPAHRAGQRLAAALLLPGSGPVDRNGDVPRLGVRPRTVKLIADRLSDHGIMSLRFDKYFTGQTGAGAYAEHPARIDLAAFIRQAVAAYHLLAGQPETRKEALLVAGHSEGGLYALLTAQHARPYPAGLALLQPIAEPLLSTVELQATAQLVADVAAGRLDPATAKRNAAGVRQAIGQFRAGRPADTSTLLPGIVRRLTPELLTAENERYVRQGDAVHPLAAAARVAPGTRVLVTAGTRDRNIPVSAIRLLALVLGGAGATGPGLRVLTGTDHFLHETAPASHEAADHETAPASHDPVLAPAARAALAEWARPYAAASGA
jgi:alpha-beta hydrolase superfamily lysophospholipase